MKHWVFEKFRRFAGDVVVPERPPEDPSAPSDWILVTPKDSRGWILDAICREIGSRVRGTWRVAYNPKGPLPPARVYFFSHYWNFLDRLQKQPEILKSTTLVWYTHPREIPYTRNERIEGLSRCTKVISACSLFRAMLIDEGLAPDKVEVVLGAASPFLFRPHKRTGEGVVGLASAFYERKNPDRLLEIVKLMKHRRFLLIGRHWETYERFNELLSARNFEYLTASYDAYPALYRRMDVFLSLALLEGGPIPLVESMMSNVVPVASATGFAPDLITQGQNGLLFDPKAAAEDIVPLIDRAYTIRSDIRASVRSLTWSKFAHKVISFADSREGGTL